MTCTQISYDCSITLKYFGMGFSTNWYIWSKEHVKGWSRIRPPLIISLLEVYITSQLWPPVGDYDKSCSFTDLQSSPKQRPLQESCVSFGEECRHIKAALKITIYRLVSYEKKARQVTHYFSFAMTMTKVCRLVLLYGTKLFIQMKTPERCLALQRCALLVTIPNKKYF